MSKRRPLTDDQLGDSLRLQAIYTVKKAEMEASGGSLTQAQIAHDFGWQTQAAASQYLNLKIPLSMEVVVRFARYFDVHVADISPRFAELIMPTMMGSSDVRPADTVPLFTWETVGVDHDSVQRAACGIPHSGYVFALSVKDSSMHNQGGRYSFDKGDLIYVDGSARLESGVIAVVRIEGREAAFMGLYVAIGDKGEGVLRMLNPGWPEREIALGAGAKVLGVVRGRVEVY
ncbi:LexA family protein [Marinobacter sp. ELB17]|uniref:LexA family protein n=1 Tax=Marinobacter sp. ELB17 TaxID=270374 RepID=UPI0000F37226|nr:S24 family peptidase [Marinobacter sp. ELB17]EAZ97006.1 putative cI prophage repressor protein [Marinobacter sp. ELB17]